MIEEYVERHINRCRANEVLQLAMKAVEGKGAEWSDIVTYVTDAPVVQIDEVKLVSHRLAELFQNVDGIGMQWPLTILNQSIGRLRKGMFGFVFARPETGKTTFISHVVMHMARQTEGVVIWFNNEEEGESVAIRQYQSAFGVGSEALWADIQKYDNEWKRIFGDRVKLVDEPAITKGMVERLCKQYNPSLIVFDQLDKIHGFHGDRDDQKFKAMYQWARELAKRYGPVIAVCQAAGTGDGKLYLEMNDVDMSRTAKQGEADFMIGIGRDPSKSEFIRGISVLKNKGTKESTCIPALRHVKAQVIIQPTLGQYVDYEL